MSDMLSQEEINALLNGLEEENSSDAADTEAHTNTSTTVLSEDEKDAIGEISNISMGTAATTLFTLVNNKVVITTPQVSLSSWKEFSKMFVKPLVAIQIIYKEGLDGSNVLMLKEKDVKIITDLMMGGDGSNIDDTELSDLHLSAISEAMNQMIGSSATSMSSMFKKKIDINPPISNLVNMQEEVDTSDIAEFLSDEFILVSFRMQIGDLVDSQIMQLYPLNFAKDLFDSFTNAKSEEQAESAEKSEEVSAPEQVQQTMQQAAPTVSNETVQQPQNPYPNAQSPNFNFNPSNMGMGYEQDRFRNVEVQNAQFQNFDVGAVMQQKENIGLIMDVPLEVTVELGRTKKSIKEILEFSPGTILELNKLAGEPIDVLVNGKMVAKGEVVVIDENFGIRINEIIKPVKLDFYGSEQSTL